MKIVRAVSDTSHTHTPTQIHTHTYTHFNGKCGILSSTQKACVVNSVFKHMIPTMTKKACGTLDLSIQYVAANHTVPHLNLLNRHFYYPIRWIVQYYKYVYVIRIFINSFNKKRWCVTLREYKTNYSNIGYEVKKNGQKQTQTY